MRRHSRFSYRFKARRLRLSDEPLARPQCGVGDMRYWPDVDEYNLKLVMEGARSVGVEF